MQELNQQEAARDILNALRGGEMAPVDPPVAPNLTGLREAEAAKRRAEYESQCSKYADYLLSKSASALNADEQKFLMRAVAQWAREEGR